MEFERRNSARRRFAARVDQIRKAIKTAVLFLGVPAPRIDPIIGILAKNPKLYPETFIDGINALGVESVSDLVATRYEQLWKEILRIKKYRNKLIHGQITGLGIKSIQLERDTLWIVEWVSCLAAGAENKFGYDGLRRNTYRQAKATSRIAVATYPFTIPSELKKWLAKLTDKGLAKKAL